MSTLFHVSIQPCFDRKLEAARDGYFTEDSPSAAEGGGAMVPYTDCVLSTAELLEWMVEMDDRLPWRSTLLDSPLLSSAEVAATTRDPKKGVDEASVVAAHMEGSGGYHRRVMDYMRRRYGCSNTGAEGEETILQPASYAVQRNRNHQLYTSSDLPGHVICIAYGFQQLQNVVRGLKRNLPAMRSYTFIEMMGCPDGCLNGGGQIKPADAQLQPQTLRAVEESFAKHLCQDSAEADTCECEARGGGGDESETALSCNKDASAKEAHRPILFSPESVAAMLAAVGPETLRITFRDRQREFEQMLDEGNIHSLKW